MRDAFGVDRPDLITKADRNLNSRRAKDQRFNAASSAGTGLGPFVAAGYAPKEHRRNAALRAAGRSTAEGAGGAIAGGALGYGISALSRGRIRPIIPTGVGAIGGGWAGEAHGLHETVRTTQRRHGVQTQKDLNRERAERQAKKKAKRT